MTAELEFNENGYVTAVLVGKFRVLLENGDETNRKLREAIQQSEAQSTIETQRLQKANELIADGVIELIMKHGRLPVALG